MPIHQETGKPLRAMRLPVNSLALKCGWYPANYHATLGSANIVVAWRWKVREEIGNRQEVCL
jgi:hypothetical protein